MSNRRYTQFFNTLHTKPILIDCNFQVSSVDPAGYGIVPSSLKGAGIQNVYMHANQPAITTTSVFGNGVSSITVASSAGLRVGATVTDSTTGGNISGGTTILAISGNVLTLSAPTAGASASSPGDTLSFANLPAVGSPNPQAGVIVVKFQDNYNRYFGAFDKAITQLGTPQSTTTKNVAYVITALGTATLAEWQAAGLPYGITPAVGVAFVATATGTIGGSATVAPSPSAGAGWDHIEVLGDPNLSIKSNASNVPGGSQSGSYIILQCFKEHVISAPVDGSNIQLAFYFSGSSIMVQGE